MLASQTVLGKYAQLSDLVVVYFIGCTGPLIDITKRT